MIKRTKANTATVLHALKGVEKRYVAYVPRICGDSTAKGGIPTDDLQNADEQKVHIGKASKLLPDALR